MENSRLNIFWGLLRILMGWLLFWSFLDKTFGLGFATTAEKAWIAGGSPTKGFLTHGTRGPLAEGFQGLAGNPVVDCLFMAGLLLIGLALILGIGVRIAGYAGMFMMLLIYAAGFLPPKNNPLVDHHVIYMVLFLGFALTRAGDTLGLGKQWSDTGLVRKFPLLE